MRAQWMTLGLLAGLLICGTGASVEGVRQAEEWQRTGDLALMNHQWEEGYIFYSKNVETFPRTRHGRLAAFRGNYVRGKLSNPSQMSIHEDWLGELYDILTW